MRLLLMMGVGAQFCSLLAFYAAYSVSGPGPSCSNVALDTAKDNLIAELRTAVSLRDQAIHQMANSR